MFLSALSKEFKLVFRDLHSLLVLFAMPAAFIIIMSLAMQEEFSDDTPNAKVSILIYNASESESALNLTSTLLDNDSFAFALVNTDIYASSGQEDVRKLLGREEKAYLYIPTDYNKTIGSGLEQKENVDEHESKNKIEVWLSPKIETRTRQLIHASLAQVMAQSQLSDLFNQSESAEGTPLEHIFENDAFDIGYIFNGNNDNTEKRPSSVQQNVPAWLIFSMFFVVIPISTTMVTEKQQGTLNRLRTMDVSMAQFLCAKIAPYLIINQLQLIVMLILGVYIIPLLGGDSLTLGKSYAGLALMSLSTGFAAVGYGLFIAIIARTTEQATSLGGVGNILLGAIGGIMVPKFVMPEFMQTATIISPMSWGLDGFLDIFLSDGGINGILTEAAMLSAFGMTMISLSIILFYRQK